MPKFEVTLSPLYSVLSYTRSYKIPSYQRPYSWKIGRVEELWDDLVEEYKEQGRMGAEYLLGSIVTVERKGKNGAEKNEVVDGQQRLVSLTLMFCALRDSLNLRLKQCTGELSEHVKSVIRQIEKHIFGETGSLIELNNNDDQILFSAICHAEETKGLKKNASKAILRNYNKFCRRTENLYEQINVDDPQLSGVKKLSGIIDAIINRVFVVDVVAKNEYEAGQIFQALNSKNQTLTQSDLIKNYLVQQQSEGMEAAWSTAIAPFENALKGKPEKADDYVYDSMMSRYCQSDGKDVSKKYLYKAVKESEVKDDPVAAKEFVAKLKVDMKIIDKLENPPSDKSDISHLLYGLKQVNVRYFRRSIIAAVRLWGWEDDRTHSLIDLILKFFFMYKTVLKMDIDKIRNAARLLTKKLVEEADSVKVADLYGIVLEPIYKSREKDKADLKEFHERFLNHFLVQEYRDNSIKYIFISIERELQKEFNVTPEGYDVEHVFPQKAATTAWPNYAELKPYRNNIGNLTLLPRKWNKLLQNYRFEVKKIGIKDDGRKIIIKGKFGKVVVSYENSKLELNRYFQKCDRWDHTRILDRQNNLKGYAEDVWDLVEYDNQARNVSKTVSI